MSHSRDGLFNEAKLEEGRNVLSIPSQDYAGHPINEYLAVQVVQGAVDVPATLRLYYDEVYQLAAAKALPENQEETRRQFRGIYVAGLYNSNGEVTFRNTMSSAAIGFENAVDLLETKFPALKAKVQETVLENEAYRNLMRREYVEQAASDLGKKAGEPEPPARPPTP